MRRLISSESFSAWAIGFLSSVKYLCCYLHLCRHDRSRQNLSASHSGRIGKRLPNPRDRLVESSFDDNRFRQFILCSHIFHSAFDTILDGFISLNSVFASIVSIFILPSSNFVCLMFSVGSKKN